MRPKPLIVGESNHFGGDEHFALYPEPEGCSGDRLCGMVMGLRRSTYMESFDRANLVRGRWSMSAARERVNEFVQRGYRVNLLLGRKVSSAFGFTEHWQPSRLVSLCRVVFILLPHPSGLNRLWNRPGIVEACREVLRGALPKITFGEL